MQFHSLPAYLFFCYRAVSVVFNFFASIKKKEMCVHESALLLNSFQSYQTKYWVPFYFDMRKGKDEMCL